MQKILILGVNGFIGARIAQIFSAKNYNVVGSFRSSNWRLEHIQIPTVEIDGTSNNWKNQIQEINPDVIINCIAYGNSSAHQNKFLTYKTNVEFLGELLEFANKELSLKAFIQLGSSSEYGKNCDYADEDFELVPNSHYSASKGAGSLLCKHFGKEKNLPIIYLRLFSIYGILEDHSRLIPQLISNALQNKFPLLANPNIARDFVFVDDLVGCIETAIPKAMELKGEIINVCSGTNTTLFNIAHQIREEFNISESPVFSTLPNRSWDIQHWNGNPKKAATLLNWKSTTPLLAGIQQTKNWMLKND